MKHIVKFLALLILTASLASAAVKISLVWDAPTVSATSGEPAGYILYRKVIAGAEVTWTEVARATAPATTLDVTTIGGGTFALTAFNAAGESNRSNEVTVTGKPGVPLNVRVTIEVQ
jgi:hypothetical protein